MNKVAECLVGTHISRSMSNHYRCIPNFQNCDTYDEKLESCKKCGWFSTIIKNEILGNYCEFEPLRMILLICAILIILTIVIAIIFFRHCHNVRLKKRLKNRELKKEQDEDDIIRVVTDNSELGIEQNHYDNNLHHNLVRYTEFGPFP